MARVVVLAHEGVECALPASQVVGADTVTLSMDDEPLSLFRGSTEARASSRAARRFLRVHTGEGERSVACEDARFEWLAEDQIHPLPEVLSRAMGLPHVVGVAHVVGARASAEERWVWLVDLARWGARDAS